MADEYFCGSCDAYRRNQKCEKCGKPTVTVGRKGNRPENHQELRERWKKLYGGRY